VLLALLAHSGYNLATEIGDGATYLKAQQLGDGSFGFGGPGVPYATALAGLDLVGAEVASPFSTETEDAIGNLLTTQDVDGSWTQQPYDTALAAQALRNHGEPPTADAGPDQAIVDAGGDCVETVSLNGSGIAVNGTITDYSWSEECAVIATGPSPTQDFTAGDHTVVLTVTDSDGQTSSDTVSISVTATILDTDLDGSPDACNDCTGPDCAIDCDSANPAVWTEPGEATLTLSYSHVTGETEITWLDLTIPDEIDDVVPGGGLVVTYDTLRASDASDFVGGTLCLESGETDISTVDADILAPGAVAYYLVRVDNDCPATGNTGSSSAGVPRAATTCS
jgi:hypothetical protein